MMNFMNKRLLYFISLMSIAWVMLLLPGKTPAQEIELEEYQIKAAFLYNFARFIEWPEKVFTNNSSINLCILGEDPFNNNLDTIHKKPVRDRILTVRRVNTVQEVRNCQIIFISASEKNNLMHILNELKGLSIFTIGDTEGFAQQGVIINFYIEQDRVRFEINVNAAKHSKLQISSKLLKLARIIDVK